MWLEKDLKQDTIRGEKEVIKGVWSLNKISKRKEPVPQLQKEIEFINNNL